MHRLVVRTIAVAALAGLLAGGSLAAQAKSPHSKHWGGKTPAGKVVSFDPATAALVVDMADGDDFTGALAPDAQIKLDHRGHSRRDGDHGNPTRGSVEDLVAGAEVLRLKVEDDAVTKIRLRPAPAAAPSTPPPADDDATDSADDSTDDADDDAPDDETGGDEEDALPPPSAP